MTLGNRFRPTRKGRVLLVLPQGSTGRWQVVVLSRAGNQISKRCGFKTRAEALKARANMVAAENGHTT
jgi:hypothetical protein